MSWPRYPGPTPRWWLPAIRTVFAQPDAAAVAAQFERITATWEHQFQEVTAMLVDAREDLLAGRLRSRGT